MDKLERLKQWHTEQPSDPFILFAMAKECANQGLISESLAYFDQLANVDPNYVGMYLHWGRVWHNTGDLSKAMATYKKGIEVATKVGDFHAKAELMAALQDLSLSGDQ
jgi:tetratricopeptide (TPR) repeat protein